MTRLVIRDRDHLNYELQVLEKLRADEAHEPNVARTEATLAQRAAIVGAEYGALVEGSAHSDGQGLAWIAVADQVPPVDSFGWSFECWCAGGTEVYRGFYSPDGNFYDEGGEVFHGMTHWQPIVEPAPPVDGPARSTQNSVTPSTESAVQDD